jgi:hypothetical protein
MKLPPVITHTPDRPSWDCAVCGEPWPCAPGKVELAEKYTDRHALALYLQTALRLMIDDLATGPLRTNVPASAFDRILGWASALTTTSSR